MGSLAVSTEIFHNLLPILHAGPGSPSCLRLTLVVEGCQDHPKLCTAMRPRKLCRDHRPLVWRQPCKEVCLMDPIRSRTPSPARELLPGPQPDRVQPTADRGGAPPAGGPLDGLP
ncbi:avirulence protein, partial [Xanthomonas oryzae pv. oryzae]